MADQLHKFSFLIKSITKRELAWLKEVVA